jgi:murein L,D-transpeptidase YcbB/YkuD
MSQRKLWKLIVFMAAIVMLAGFNVTAAAEEPNGSDRSVADLIRNRIVVRNGGTGFVCRGEPICGIELLPLFYIERDCRPAWLDENGLHPSTSDLVNTIRASYREGLEPSQYHLATIEALVALLEQPANALVADRSNTISVSRSIPRNELYADLDIMLTDAFLLLGSHLSAGRVNPETLHHDWLFAEKSVDLMAALNSAVIEDRLGTTIAQLRPSHADYHRLTEALQRLRDVADRGGWPQLPPGETLHPGDYDQGISGLRQRLEISGDLTPTEMVSDPLMYDDQLVTALKRFQRRHGLEPDGLVGRNTMDALNTSTEARIRQVELNLERWRWLPGGLGERYILVNTADFGLKVVENQHQVLGMRVVVGRPARRSPVFSASMTYMVLNPYWTVPTTIAVKDILPHLKNGVDYLAREGIKVFNGWTDEAREIDPHMIDWSLYNANHFPFRLRQEPGPENALGRIKFMFPNRFAVYLHDTPHRSLFQRVQRDFSSGCIRVEDALGLAQYLLKNDPQWPRATLLEALKSGRRQIVQLKNPATVHLLYMTAWVDEQGTLQFRNDIYGRDVDLDKALRYRPGMTQQ